MYLDISFGLKLLENVSVLFRKAFSHPYTIPTSHTNGFGVTKVRSILHQEKIAITSRLLDQNDRHSLVILLIDRSNWTAKSKVS